MKNNRAFQIRDHSRNEDRMLDVQRRGWMKDAALAPMLVVSAGIMAPQAFASTACTSDRIRYYDFNAAVNGDGASPLTPSNTWVHPQDGDTIRLKRGSRWIRNTQLSLGNVENLTFEAWYSADGSDDPSRPKPIVQHSAPNVFVWNFQGDGVHRIRNIRFEGCSSGLNGAVIGSGLVSKTQCGAQLEIENCEFHSASYNAIRLGGRNAQAAPSFKAVHCVFDQIGEDAVYGGALQYEVGHCTMSNLSASVATGDGVGFIDANPVFVWIHDNVIDHSTHDAKHCVMIDTLSDHEGLAVIEDNILLGYGSGGAGIPQSHTVVNSQARTILRRNKIKSSGIAVNLSGDFSECIANLIEVRGVNEHPVVAIQGSGCRFENNTVMATAALSGARVVVASTSVTGVSVRNNVFTNFPSGTVVTLNPYKEYRCSNNAFENVAACYSNLVGSTDDLIVNTSGGLGISPNGSLQTGSPLIGSGVHLGYRLDLFKHPFCGTTTAPAIGAVEQAGGCPLASGA